MTDPSESVTRFKGSVPIGTTRPAGRIRQPEGSSVDPSGNGPGTSRPATSAAPAMAGSASRERLSMGRNMAARGTAGSPLALGAMTGLIFHLIPHTHWDREWYLPRAALQARLVGVVDDLIERLQADPGYRSFLLDGQTVLPADAERLFAAWAPVRGPLVQRATSKHIPVFIGADHHAAHPDVPRLRDLLAELDPQSAFRVSRLDEFFQAAADGAKPAPLAGELRWSYRYTWTLQGVHGTRAPLKRRYSAGELALVRLAEPLAA